MNYLYPRFLTSLGALSLGCSAHAAEFKLTLEIPRITVAEYHRPYVVAWVENAEQISVGSLAVWYDTAMRNNQGARWLRDVRQWWRRGGNALTLPADGISGATRPVGTHQLSFGDQHPLLSKLPAGDYVLQVEAAREVGGREVVSLPFQWPPQKIQQLQTKGSSELGSVSIELKP